MQRKSQLQQARGGHASPTCCLPASTHSAAAAVGSAGGASGSLIDASIGALRSSQPGCRVGGGGAVFVCRGELQSVCSAPAPAANSPSPLPGLKEGPNGGRWALRSSRGGLAERPWGLLRESAGRCQIGPQLFNWREPGGGRLGSSCARGGGGGGGRAAPPHLLAVQCPERNGGVGPPAPDANAPGVGQCMPPAAQVAQRRAACLQVHACVPTQPACCSGCSRAVDLSGRGPGARLEAGRRRRTI